MSVSSRIISLLFQGQLLFVAQDQKQQTTTLFPLQHTDDCVSKEQFTLDIPGLGKAVLNLRLDVDPVRANLTVNEGEEEKNACAYTAAFRKEMIELEDSNIVEAHWEKEGFVLTLYIPDPSGIHPNPGSKLSI